MHISDERLKEFQEAYEADFNEEITKEEAREMLSRLTKLYELLIQPLPSDQRPPERKDPQQHPA